MKANSPFVPPSTPTPADASTRSGRTYGHPVHSHYFQSKVVRAQGRIHVEAEIAAAVESAASQETTAGQAGVQASAAGSMAAGAGAPPSPGPLPPGAGPLLLWMN
jgi:hypothetical protein